MTPRWAWALGVPLALVSAAAAAAATTQEAAAAAAGGGPAATLRQPARLPIVVSTWAGAGSFSDAAAAALQVLQAGGSALDAVVEGCSACERLQCDRTVGHGGSPDELGGTSLDALVMDGTSMRAGAVANLRRCRHAARAARLVLDRTTHSLLAGEQADRFAGEMGLPLEPSLADDWSRQAFASWRDARCQPNFRRRVTPDPTQSCGPFQPDSSSPSSPVRSGGAASASAGSAAAEAHEQQRQGAQQQQQAWPSEHAHDTIALVAVAADGSVAAGASSNGATHKVPGRVGDAAVPGGGAYADSEVGGCGATGDGDVHLAFSPCYQVVESMRQGMAPQAAAEDAVRRIARRIPSFVGAVVAVSADGRHGGAAHGWTFRYSVAGGGEGGGVRVVEVPPLDAGPSSSSSSSSSSASSGLV